MSTDNFAAIVLAAGKGTRLADGLPSPKPKVLYDLVGRPMISYTLEILQGFGFRQIIIVVGYKAREVESIVGKGYKFAKQDRQLGTADALKAGLSKVSPRVNNVLVLNGDDSAFYKPETIEAIMKKHIGKGNTLTFVSLELEDPKGLGRVIRNGKKVVRIVEEKAADKQQKKIKEVNDGLYIFRRFWLEANLPKIKKSRVGEYYLGDLVWLAASQGEKVQAFKLPDSSEWRGVNSSEELVVADKLMRERLLNASKER